MSINWALCVSAAFIAAVVAPVCVLSNHLKWYVFFTVGLTLLIKSSSERWQQRSLAGPTVWSLKSSKFQPERTFGLSLQQFTNREMASTKVIRWIFACALIGGFSISGASQTLPPANPQQSAIGNVPSMTTATYGDWVVRCS